MGRRRGSDPALLWLWCRVAAAALIRPLAWDLPYAAGAGIKKKKKKKKKISPPKVKGRQEMNLIAGDLF